MPRSASRPGLRSRSDSHYSGAMLSRSSSKVARNSWRAVQRSRRGPASRRYSASETMTATGRPRRVSVTGSPASAARRFSEVVFRVSDGVLASHGRLQDGHLHGHLTRRPARSHGPVPVSTSLQPPSDMRTTRENISQRLGSVPNGLLAAVGTMYTVEPNSTVASSPGVGKTWPAGRT